MTAASGLIGAILVALQVSTPSPDVRETQQRLRVAEDQRAGDGAARALLLASLEHPDVTIRLQAVRALGRIEDPGLVVALSSSLDDESLEVRTEAAHALAQSQMTSEGPGQVASLLLTRLAKERDGMVRGAIATSVGRLPYVDSVSATTAAEALSTLVPRGVGDGPVPSSATLVGVARGTVALARRCAQQKIECASLSSTLSWLARAGTSDGPAVVPVVAARIRRLAASALSALEPLPADTLRTLARDDDDQVRRLAVIALATTPGTTEASLLAWLNDPAAIVRHAVVSRAGARTNSVASRALADPDVHVRLAALDALGAAKVCNACEAIVVAGVPTGGGWHQFAHALVALARTDGARARAPLASAATHEVWQVRMYSARAAAEAGALDVLRDLARDMHPNVREAALDGLHMLGHRDSDDVRLEALGSHDYQLVLTAAQTLEATPRRAAAQTALLETLQRLTRDDRDTARDPRTAVVERLGEIGDSAVVERLRPYLSDPDPVVAGKVADVIAARTGTRPPVVAAARSGSRALPLPSPDDIDALDGRHVNLTLQDGTVVTIRLAGRDAPANAARFAQQVAAGEWDGLSWHRVEPGFVVQGGSPGANEYMGAARYTRDERGSLSHVRGTVGISTRGRDTGDGQIFVNLVDNPRLDFSYTIIGSIVSGMSSVDALLEGAVITRAELPPR